jgi:hypothetical protein
VAVETLYMPMASPRYWSSTYFHQQMVNYAQEFLMRSCGFNPKDLHCEKRVAFGHYYYVVDVAAITDHPCVAVECGSAPETKLRELEKVFYRVIHLQPTP